MDIDLVKFILLVTVISRLWLNLVASRGCITMSMAVSHVRVRTINCKVENDCISTTKTLRKQDPRYKMIAKAIFLLCFVTLLQPVWVLLLSRTDGNFSFNYSSSIFKRTVECLFIYFFNFKLAFKTRDFSCTSRPLRPFKRCNC